MSLYKEILPVLIIFLMFAIAFYAEPRVVTNGRGMLASYPAFGSASAILSEKVVGVYLMPVLALVVYVGLLLIPRIDAYHKNLEDFAEQFWGFKVILVFALGIIYLATLLPNLGFFTRLDPMVIIVAAVAMLFFYVGYMLNFTKRNHFIGISTPWTIADEKVWAKTNQLGGRLFWACGALALVSMVSPADSMLWLILLPFVLIVIGLSVYSLQEYRKTKEISDRRRKKKSA
ncbi:SdpI/YhfL protein family protein [uncultured archaeon]|nr:SdpI/YhfL protein family protein [uncultured archaeon]